jgi:hypothetical protein
MNSSGATKQRKPKGVRRINYIRNLKIQINNEGSLIVILVYPENF